MYWHVSLYFTIMYFKMEHVTRIVHGLHIIAEVCKHFTKVKHLISNVKQFYFKCLARVQFFRDKAPINPLSQKSVLTWLNTVIYFCEHFETFES